MKIRNGDYRDVTEQVIQYLEELSTGKVAPRDNTGICSNIAMMFDPVARAALYDVFENMGYPGDARIYPVAGGREYYSYEGGRWDGPRGDARRAFCAKVAQWLRDNNP